MNSHQRMRLSEPSEKPDLIIDGGDLPATARELRDALASSGELFDRGVPVSLVIPADGGPPTVSPLSPHQVVWKAHQIRRPVKLAVDGGLVAATLPTSIARMYLAMAGEWDLPHLAGISTAPLLSSDGTIRTVEGYDPVTKLWCEKVPELKLPEAPTRDEALEALLFLRKVFRRFPFADAAMVDDGAGEKIVDIDQGTGRDESAFLVGLLTAICRPSLWLAPGFLARAPQGSGAGTGKGLLVRAMCAIAFGVQPRAFTKGGDRQELDKRLAADLIEAAQSVFLDNVNDTILLSDLLASTLTERPCRIRMLGRTRMVALNSTAFIAVTGNGVTLSGDLIRRFLVCEIDARCEDPEQRSFESGFLKKIEDSRAELLGAALTIWRWGRQNAATLHGGRPLGSFEDWAAWCRDPLLALGCCDPVERIDRLKADDPRRRQIVELYEAWNAHHGELPIKAADLAAPVRALIDPQGRNRHHLETRLMEFVGTWAGGFVLMRQEAGDRRGTCAFALRSSFGEGSGTAASTCVDDETAVAAPQQSNGLITIDLGRGRSIRVKFDAEPLVRLLDVLDGRR
jgi:hypothetical protein